MRKSTEMETSKQGTGANNSISVRDFRTLDGSQPSLKINMFANSNAGSDLRHDDDGIFSGKRRNRKTSPVPSFHATRWLALILCLSSWCDVKADWIDQETPIDARTTEAYTARPPPAPSPAPTILYDDDFYFDSDTRWGRNSTIRGPKKWKPTPAPSVAPSQTPVHPTAEPSEMPTATPGAYKLVFSDEFNTPSRTFDDGSDPRWTAIEKNDYTNNALHYYSAKNAYTNDDGELVIVSEPADTDVVGYDDVKRKKTHVTKHFRSAMLQSWNKFCFTGGIIEAEVTMPGRHNVGGLWPAFWLLGNLARHTYVGSSEHIWPWSDTKCTKKSAASQAISGCHNAAHYGMKVGVGRGAPEIDIFEVQPGNVKHNTGVFSLMPVGQPFASASYQVAPGRPVNRPGNGYWPGPGQWYEGLVGGTNTTLNINFYGSYNHFRGDPHPEISDYWSDAISFNRQLTEDHFDKPHVYRLEWEVPTEDRPGHLHWFLDGKLVLAINGQSLRDAKLGQEISSEPSYIIFNTAISSEWGFPKECPAFCRCKKYNCYANNFEQTCGFSEGFCDMMKNERPQMKVNWVRVYQDPSDPTQKVGCSTPERPTRRWIEAHAKMYKQEHDLRPLKNIQRGRGSCIPGTRGDGPDNCGGLRHGRCTAGRVCECMPGWTGPNCLALEGRDPILYDAPDDITDIGFELPDFFSGVSRFLVVALAVIVAAFLLFVGQKKSLEDWTPIPEVDGTLLNPK